MSLGSSSPSSRAVVGWCYVGSQVSAPTRGWKLCLWARAEASVSSCLLLRKSGVVPSFHCLPSIRLGRVRPFFAPTTPGLLTEPGSRPSIPPSPKRLSWEAIYLSRWLGKVKEVYLVNHQLISNRDAGAFGSQNRCKRKARQLSAAVFQQGSMA